MVLLARSSLWSSTGPKCQAPWTKKTIILVTRRRTSAVSWLWSIPSRTISSRIGMTWRKSGTTPSFTSSGLCLRTTPSCSRKLLWTPRSSCSRRSTCPPSTWRSRLVCLRMLRDAQRASWWTHAALRRAKFPSTKSREAAVSLCGKIRNRVGKPAGRRHHGRSHRVRLPPGSISSKRRLRAAISDAISSPRRVASTSSGKTPVCLRRAAPPCSKGSTNALRRSWLRWHRQRCF